ncbi:MAG: helix-turn-helix transcriptional regulator [Chitinophagaceae bacterium]|nr:helix-turn-helix transcriptional regulator [Chitinophagaceae bacterium]
MGRKNLKNKIDWYIICQVRQMRTDNDLSQDDIAIHLNLSKGYIGHIESPNFIAKYNTGHLNELAKLFKCSPKDFMPEKAL